MTISRIQFRRGTTSQWTTENPVLALGEPGIELKTDNSIAMKIGDGSTAWSTLEYAFSDEFATQSDIATAIANLIDSAPTTLDTLNELATALGDDPNFATTILTELSGKADSSHTHAISDITNLETELNSKSEASSTETLTNKTINFSNNTISGTVSEFNTALSDANFVTTTDGTITTTGIIGKVTVNSGSTANVGKIFVHNPSSGNPTGAVAGDIWIY